MSTNQPFDQKPLPAGAGDEKAAREDSSDPNDPGARCPGFGPAPPYPPDCEQTHMDARSFSPPSQLNAKITHGTVVRRLRLR